MIDKSGANTAALETLNADTGVAITIRSEQCSGTGSSGDKTDRPAHAGIPVLQRGPPHLAQDRTDAHD